jgi:hypothetical protein
MAVSYLLEYPVGRGNDGSKTKLSRVTVNGKKVQKIFPIRMSCDQTCHSHRDDGVRDWQWLGLDGITQDNGHGLADGMPTLGICTVEAVGQPLPIAFCCVSRLDRLTF